MNHFFYHLISFFNAAFFILLGGFFSLLPWFGSLQNIFNDFLIQQPYFFFLFGLLLFLIGLGTAIYLCLILRHQTYTITSSKKKVEIDQNVINNALEQYLKRLFPKQNLAYHVTFSTHKFYVEADLPYISEDQREELIKKIELETADLFQRVLGYDKEYILSLNFQTLKKEST